MSCGVSRSVWLLVLLALGLPLSTLGQGTATRNAAPVAPAELSGRPFDAKFTDVAADAGLDMRFVFGDDSTKSYIIEVNGGGASFVDYDGDGWLDIFLVNGSRLKDSPAHAVSRLYRNTKDGKFVDVSESAGVARRGWGSGVCAGDYDNDGDTDLYVSYWGLNAMFRNDGEGGFADVAPDQGVAGRTDEWTSGCTFLDIDRDGDLDLLTTRYQEFDPKNAPKPGTDPSSSCNWKGMPVFCGPRGLPYGGVTLYQNNGREGFSDITREAGLLDVDSYYAFTAVAADFNGDGWVDVYIACDSTASILFVNNGDGSFTDFGIETGVAYNEHGFEQGGMGIAVGDIDRDGWLDIIKTNFVGDYPNVYHNVGDGLFEDIVVRAGLASNPQLVGWGVGLFDFDNDGWEDVLQVSGHVYPNLGDWPKVGESYDQPPVLYRNLGAGRFEDVSKQAGSAFRQELSSRGAAFGDYDNDGDVDAVVVNMAGRPSLLRNDLGGDGHWVRVQLRGVKSNKSAIGAIVRVRAGGARWTRPVLSQDSFLSHSDLRVHVGLGAAATVDGFDVVWPDGTEESFPGGEADKEVILVEGRGTRVPESDQ